MFTDRHLLITETRRPFTFKQVVSVTYNNIIKFLDFDDIKNLITALNLQFVKFDYDTITLDNLNHVEYLLKRKWHFNYLGLTIIGVNLDQKRLTFNKSVKHLILEQIQTNHIPNINHLSNLQSFSIKNNRLKYINKTLPPNIEHLDLSFNEIKKIKNINHLTKLVTLDLSCNYHLTIIDNLDNLINLTEINLSNNKIRIIDRFDKLVNLTKINLSNNRITTIENLDKQTALRELILTNNKIVKIENLNNLTEMTYLNISCNKINMIQNLYNCRNLQVLDLRNNCIDIIDNLEHNKHLKILLLANNNISLLTNIFHLKDITTLDLGSNPIHDVDEEGIKQNFVHLEELYLPVFIDD